VDEYQSSVGKTNHTYGMVRRVPAIATKDIFLSFLRRKQRPKTTRPSTIQENTSESRKWYTYASTIIT
jgi:hypothetical protein